MRTDFMKYKFSWFVAFCLTAILVIIACNLWLLCNGHCVIKDFLHIPPIGWVLLLANLVAGLVLWAVRRRKETKPAGNSCVSCHSGLREAWTYCPKCGGERSYV